MHLRIFFFIVSAFKEQDVKKNVFLSTNDVFYCNLLSSRHWRKRGITLFYQATEEVTFLKINSVHSTYENFRFYPQKSSVRGQF